MIGGPFDPVMLPWFVRITVMGLRRVSRMPTILTAMSPSYVVHVLHAGELERIVHGRRRISLIAIGVQFGL